MCGRIKSYKEVRACQKPCFLYNTFKLKAVFNLYGNLSEVKEMKKFAIAVVLGLLVQVLPTNVFASGGDYGGSIAFAFAVVLGIRSDSNSSNPVAKDEKVAQAEFSTLNNMPKNLALLNQCAGGALDTAEIVK
jgi:hypothetical protein